MADSVSKPLTAAEDALKLVLKELLKAGEIALETAVPAFAAPPLKNIEEWALDEAFDKAFEQFRLFVDCETVKLVNTIHQSQYEKISENLAILALEKGITSPEYLQARQADAEAFAKFVRRDTFERVV